MKKMLVVLLPLLFFMLQLSGQGRTHKIDWGPTIKYEKKKIWNFTLLDFDGEHYHLLSNDRSQKAYQLLKYNQKHELIEAKEHDFKYKKKSVVLNTIRKTVSDRYAIGYHFDGKKDKYTVLFSKYEDGSFGPMKVAHEFDYVEVGRNVGEHGAMLSSKRRNNAVLINTSQQNIAYIKTLPPTSRKALEKIEIALFDNQFNLLWNKTLKLSYRHDRFSIISYAVNDEGKVLILGRAYNKKKGSSPFVIFCIGDDITIENEVNLQEEIRSVTGIKMLLREDNFDRISLTGFYNDGSTSGHTGIFCSIYDLNKGDIRSTQLHEFSSEFLSEFNSDDSDDSDDLPKGLNEYFSINSLPLYFSDGYVGLIAEHSINYTNVYRYRNNDLIAFCFSPDGSLIYQKRIAKKFETTRYRYSSYWLLSQNDQVYILFNSRPPEMETPDDMVDLAYISSELVLLDETGAVVERTQLSKHKNEDLLFAPRMSMLNDNRFLIFANDKNQFSFGTFQLTSN